MLLSDYFQPLNLQTLLLVFFLWTFFDSWGVLVKKFIDPEGVLRSRLVDWLIGLGVFVFVWFTLGFFVAPRPTPVLISVIILSLVSFPSYIKQKTIFSLLDQLWRLKIPLLIIAAFLPAVFVKASLPPYYSDEMAYHFISPGSLHQLTTWKFNGGVFQNVPRLFDTFFILSFSFTKTYSVARLTHFAILVTSMLFAYQRLKTGFNSLLTPFLLVFIFFSLPQYIVFTSTLGFVDVASYSFILIAWIAGIDFFIRNEKSSLVLSTAFWAMALGTKYTAVTALIAFTIPLILLNFSRLFAHLRPKFILRILIVSLIFGGYWYVKNFIYYGNPIYPFLFSCRTNTSEWCGATSNFFGNWTTPVTLSNLRPIVDSLFPENHYLQNLIFISPVLILLAILFGSAWGVPMWILASILIELVMLKYFSGFLPRYHQHLQLLMIALVAILASVKFRIYAISLLVKVGYIILIVVAIMSYIDTVRFTNSLKFVTQTEIDYSLGRIDIYDWIRNRLPRVVDSIIWCQNPPGGIVPLARFDPDMIWYEDDGFNRSFLTNCTYGDPSFAPISLDSEINISEVRQAAITNKLTFWSVTPNRCLPDEQVVKHHTYETDRELQMRRLNNFVVCNSEEVKPNLYYFNYALLNN